MFLLKSFFNAVMQNMSRLQKVRTHFLKNVQEEEEEEEEGASVLEGEMTAAFRQYIRSVSKVEGEERDVFCPERLFREVEKRAPRFRGRNQQDSHEVFRTILDGIIEEER